MNANELHIGFWYNYKGIPTQFTEYELMIILQCGGEYNYEGIPLTEEWLGKFGFEKNNFGFTLMNQDRNGAMFYFPTQLDGYVEYCSVVVHQDVQYVHQLQNLYFALTGEELKLK